MAKSDHSLPDDDAALFREAVADVVPLTHTFSAVTLPPIPARAHRHQADEAAVLHESLYGPIDPDLETGEELCYLRAGVQSQLLRRLRRGRYAIQAGIDLHGLTQAQAHESLNQFLCECRTQQIHCVRIVHGKGLRSPQGRSVLKAAVNRWLARCDQVLAFCSAPSSDGGTGALYVLLRRSGS